MIKTSRRKFVSSIAMMAPGFLLVPEQTFGQQERPPGLAASIVSEFVRVAHSDLDKVKQMLGEYPTLLNASWDWGKGDFETALGAAGHMGLKDYANYLLQLGARPDIFVLSMLGKTNLVKPICEEYPSLIESSGPHGFTLLHHAKQGGKEGEELFEYFSSKGLKDLHRKIFR